MKNAAQNPADFVVPLNMNGLRGRMLVVPAPKNRKREILFVYGHHSSLERWWGLVLDLNQYGAVTAPDLPGFGGMESFYKINEKATLDNYADYLAAFVKLKYKRKKVTVVGLSFGFLVVTRMLQRYPDLCNRIEGLTSIVGFAHHDDFNLSQPRRLVYKLLAKTGSARFIAPIVRYGYLNSFVLKRLYLRRYKQQASPEAFNAADVADLIDFDIYLWQANDVRTWLATTYEMLTIDNCGRQIAVPLWHIYVTGDPYFNQSVVEQHMRVIFNEYTEFKAKMASHTPSILANIEEAAPILPKQLRRLLARKPA